MLSLPEDFVDDEDADDEGGGDSTIPAPKVDNSRIPIVMVDSDGKFFLYYTFSSQTTTGALSFTL